MGFLDKVKAQAEQAVQKTQQGIAQGQAKLDQVQLKRQGDTLLRNLGAAYYAQQRHEASPDGLTAALKALDEFFVANGPIDLIPTGAGATGAASAGTASAAGTPEGDYTLDDV